MEAGGLAADSPDYKFYARALRYVRREYPDSIAWARRVTRKTFLRMKTSAFLAEYIWVVYAAGFRVAVVQSKWPALRTAFANLDLHRRARMRSPRAALRIIGNKRKATCVLRGAREITAEGFPRFKKRLLKEGPRALVALPGIGPITKDHLARTSGWRASRRTTSGFSGSGRYSASHTRMLSLAAWRRAFGSLKVWLTSWSGGTAPTPRGKVTALHRYVLPVAASLPNHPFEQTARSNSLAAAAQRER